MIGIRNNGSFQATLSSLGRMQRGDIFEDLDRYAREGVRALDHATPVETGVTSDSWGYTISRSGGKTTIAWTNTSTNDGVNIVILLQYGHGTGTGGFVAGRDFINPAIRPIFDNIAEAVWRRLKQV